MVDWQVADEKQQKVFIDKMIDNLDRFKRIDEQYYSYDKVKAELKANKNDSKRKAHSSAVSPVGRSHGHGFVLSSSESLKQCK